MVVKRVWILSPSVAIASSTALSVALRLAVTAPLEITTAPVLQAVIFPFTVSNTVSISVFLVNILSNTASIVSNTALSVADKLTVPIVLLPVANAGSVTISHCISLPLMALSNISTAVLIAFVSASIVPSNT